MSVYYGLLAIAWVVFLVLAINDRWFALGALVVTAVAGVSALVSIRREDRDRAEF